METVKETYTDSYHQFVRKNKGDFIIKIIYENLINMVLRILEEDKALKEVKNHLQSMNVYHMFGITDLLK